MSDVVLVRTRNEEAPGLGLDEVVLDEGFSAQDLAGLAKVVAVWGDDHFVAEVSRMLVSASTQHVISPLPQSSDTLFANEVHGLEDVHGIVGSLLAGNYQEREVSSLRVTDSAQPGSFFAFSFGVGQVDAAFEARDAASDPEAGLETIVRGLGSADSALRGSARVSVNYQPLADGCGWLHASTLSRSWLGTRISKDGRPRVRFGDTTLEWLRHATPLGRWVGGRDAEAFDAIHIDADTGYVVDGRRMEARPRVIQVAPGPQIQAAAVT